MSVNLSRTGGLEPPKTTQLTIAFATDVFVSSDTYGRTLETIVVANTGAATCKVTLSWMDADDVLQTFWHKNVPADDTIIISDVPILCQGQGTVKSISAEPELVDVIWITCISSAQTKQSPSAR